MSVGNERNGMKTLARTAGLSLALTALALPVWAEGDSEKGRELSIEHCARCHVVGDHNPHGGIGSTPSFQLLAKRDDYLERFETFYARRPHPVYVNVPNVPKWTDIPSHVQEITITLDEIDDIIAFVETLRPQ